MAALASALAATWFDGQSAAAHPVRVALADQALILHGHDETFLRSAPLESIQFSEALAHAPRFAYLDDGSTLEIHEATPFNAALEAMGTGPALVARLQRSARAATAALVLLMLVLVGGYTYGVPRLARWVAFALPESAEARIGDQFEKTLNLELLMVSKLAPERQRHLRAMFEKAAARAAPGVRHALKFRAVQVGPGVNAFSLPGGSIIVLDGLVDAAGSDDELLAVFGHELGHVANKHGLRNVLQAFGIGALASAIWGDFAGVVANVPVVFGALHYSREFEREADDYAVEFLHANGRSAQPLIDFFESIGKNEPKDDANGGIGDLLSTHPATRERIERLRQQP